MAFRGTVPRERKKIRAAPNPATRAHGSVRTPLSSRPASRQTASASGPRRLSPLRAASAEPSFDAGPLSVDLEWDMQVERALNGQQLSLSWSEVLREKQIAVEAALDEVSTRQGGLAAAHSFTSRPLRR